jgi:hypothetical protein
MRSRYTSRMNEQSNRPPWFVRALVWPAVGKKWARALVGLSFCSLLLSALFGWWTGASHAAALMGCVGLAGVLYFSVQTAVSD